jgi:hypothetical protein
MLRRRWLSLKHKRLRRRRLVDLDVVRRHLEALERRRIDDPSERVDENVP